MFPLKSRIKTNSYLNIVLVSEIMLMHDNIFNSAYQVKLLFYQVLTSMLLLLALTLYKTVNLLSA